MTFIKSTVAAAVIAVASFNAQAANYNLHDFVENGGVNQEFTVASAGAFIDTFTWDNFATVDFSTLAASFGQGNSVFTSISLFNNITGTVEVAAPGFIVPVPGFSMASLLSPGATLPLSAGNYTLTLEGIANSLGASYTLNAAPIAAVPEPSTLGLMFGGLGLVGLLALRARQEETVA